MKYFKKVCGIQGCELPDKHRGLCNVKFNGKIDRPTKRNNNIYIPNYIGKCINSNYYRNDKKISNDDCEKEINSQSGLYDFCSKFKCNNNNNDIYNDIYNDYMLNNLNKSTNLLNIHHNFYNKIYDLKILYEKSKKLNDNFDELISINGTELVES